MRTKKEGGFTLVELTVAIVVISVIALGLSVLFESLIKSMIIARRQSVALSLATSQLEYLKSLPYDSLAVQGGSIYSASPLPATRTDTVNGVTYTTTTTIKYVDDAYDGCGSYTTLAEKETYCRNYPPPASAPALDSNPKDYKIVHVSTTDNTGVTLASVDTEITARVAESASTTGAIFVTVLDGSGAPVSGATVTVSNNTLSPVVNMGDTTDSNGKAIFYDAPPDSGNDYVITASKAGWSSLTTIAATGTLQPTYPMQKVLAQQSSGVTLTLQPMTSNSLVIETTNTNGTPIAGVKVYVKGGYKKYTDITDTTYYYDTMAGSDTRPTTDATGQAAITNLVPLNEYIFCGDLGDTGCSGGSTYYLAAAVPYGGPNSLGPITIPPYPSGSPPALPYVYNSQNYLQKVRLMLTTNASFPRVFAMSPTQVSLSGGTNLSAFSYSLTGVNLSGATISLTLGAQTYTGTSCNYSTDVNPPQLEHATCNFDLTGISTGDAQLTVTNGAGTLTLPVSPLGGLSVTP